MALNEYKRKRDFKKTAEPAGRKAKSLSGKLFVVQKHAASHLHYDFRLELDGTLKSWAVPKGPSLDSSVKSLAVHVEDHPIDYGNFEGTIPAGQYGGGTVMLWDTGTWEAEGDAAKNYKAGKLVFHLHGKKLMGRWTLVRMGGRFGNDGKNWLLIKSNDEAAKSATDYDILEKQSKSIKTGRTMDQITKGLKSKSTSKSKSAKKTKTIVKKSASRSKTARSSKTIAREKKLTRRQLHIQAVLTKPRKSKKSVRGSANALIKKMLVDSRAIKKNQPRTLHPQLATLASQVPQGNNWIHELKFDGYRLLAFFEDSEVRLVTRRGNDWTSRFKHLASHLGRLPIKNGILDGEVVSMNDRGISNFQQLQNAINLGNDNALIYYVFDAIHLEGFDLSSVPLIKRKQILSRVLLQHDPHNDGPIRYSDHIEGSGDKILSQSCSLGMEGIISKRADSPYVQIRSTDWLKNKCMKRQEFVIGGFTRAEKSRVGFGALLLGYYQNGELKYCGRVGTGFTHQSLRELKAKLNKLAQSRSAFVDPPRGFRAAGTIWVKPKLVAEVEFTEWTSDGRLRHPSFQGLREDKKPAEITREKPKRLSKLTKRTFKSAR